MTQSQIINAIIAKWGQDPKEYICNNYFGYMPQDWNTPTGRHPIGNNANKNLKLSVLLGSGIVVSETESAITLKSPTSTITVVVNGKRVKEKNHFLRTVSMVGGMYQLEIFSTQEANFYTRNISVLKKHWPLYAAKFEELRGYGPSNDDEIINFMATDRYTFRYVESLYEASDLIIDVSIHNEDGECVVFLTPMIRGVAHSANSVWCSLIPKSPVNGLPNTPECRKVGTGFGTSTPFSVTSDFRKRGNYAYVMQSGDFELYASVNTIDALGNSVKCTVKRDVELQLPSFNYFH